MAGAATRLLDSLSADQGQRMMFDLASDERLYENAQNNGNHVHSVWRDFNGDFGRDLVREHLRAGALRRSSSPP